MKTAAFLYGWSEGPWQSRNFKKELQFKGFRIIKDSRQADLLIAHSAGCYLVPEDHRAQQIILIGPNYWPGRSPVTSVVLNTIRGFQLHRAGGSALWWTNKLLHNLWYIVMRPQASAYIFTKYKPANLPSADKDTLVTLVRNSSDEFCHPDIQNLLPQTKPYKLMRLPGDHEDCWLRPKPYMQLVRL